ncbi:MAG TPA: membrane-targeted effector domain-containing toxin [Pseudomonas sp.]|jgi:hypothetical protein
MQMFTPVPNVPTATLPLASAALARLSQSSTTLSSELDALPKPHDALLDVIDSSQDQLQGQMTQLLQRLETWWASPSAQGPNRRELFISTLQQALHDEVTLKTHERNLGAEYAACLPPAQPESSTDTDRIISSLHIKLNDQTLVEIKGALVMSIGQAQTLLALPGAGLLDFPTPQAMLDAIVKSLNDESLFKAILINADRHYLDLVSSVKHDPDLFLEAFVAADVQLLPITTNPFRHALNRQLDKQRQDLRYVCEKGLDADRKTREKQIDEPPASWPALEAAYVARLIDELNLRMSFGPYQRSAYGKAQNLQLMRELVRSQITALGYAAKMQGHIQPGDLDAIESIARSENPANTRLRVQQVRLNARETMGSLLVFRKEDAQGNLQRLVMFASDAPREQHFQGFDNETQLLHELVLWCASAQMSEYLLQQVEASGRPALEQTLEALRLKPYPAADFVQLVDVSSYDAGIQAFVDGYVRVALAEQARHTPNWYLQASAAQRQELVALEDAAAGATHNYQAKPHTRIQPFNDYVHERASQQISKLLGVPMGTVDPDLIIITSERETLTYTQMLLNGYDDSINFIHSSADTQATFSGPDGVDLKRLSPQSVAGSVRGKWLGDDYIALIRSTLLDANSPGYEYRRQTSLLLTQLQLKAAALRSYLKGDIHEHQYQWLKASIDNAHLSDARVRERYPFYPLQIHVDKPLIASGLSGVDQLVISSTKLTHIETVQGCFVILPTEPRQAALLYTPMAPDGVEFRLFADFTTSLHNDGMIDYYKDRCRAKSHKILSHFLHDMKQGKASKPPFIPRDGFTDMAQICFNRPIERKLRDVEESTTSRNEMITRIVWSSVEIIATVLTLPFPPASFAVGALLALHDSMRALQALTEGDQEAASGWILSSLLNSAGAAGDWHSGLKGFGRLVNRLDSPSGRRSAPNTVKQPDPLPRYDELFPVQLQDETFRVGRPDANGHALVYRGNGEEHIQATGHYATRRPNGSWEPLGQHAATPSANAVGSAREVNVSLSNITPQAQGHANGVSIVNGRHYIALHGKTYQVQYDPGLNCWNIIDPANPFAFFGKQPVRLNEQGKWQLIERSRLHGGGLDDPSGFKPLKEEAAGPSTLVTNVHDYELPQHLQRNLEVILNRVSFDPTGMGMEHYFDVLFADMRQTFDTLRENLYRDANAFFAQPVLTPRPLLPSLESVATIDGLIENVFAKTNGLIISEAPKSVSSKRLLILNMRLLAEQKVEVLYIEHLFTDLHMQKLAKYQAMGGKVRTGSHQIKSHLKHLNDGALDNLTKEYDYYHLIKAAHQHKIQVRPLSSSVSYAHLNHPVATAVGDNAAATKMSNFLAHKIIRDDTASKPSRRWVALLNQSNANTHQGVVGLAELEGAISVRVEDVPAGSPTRTSRDITGARIDGGIIKGDFKLELSNPIIRPQTEAISRLDEALSRQLDGKFLDGVINPYAGEHGFRWDEVHGWLRYEPESWITDSAPTAIAQSLTDTTYEVALESRAVMHELIAFEPKGLDAGYLFNDAQQSVVRGRFFQLRRQLQKDARNIVSGDLPTRPTLPAINPQIGLDEFLESLYQHTDGVVIGESHSSVASKKLIIDNLPQLARQNVKTLYMEHFLTDMHQADLDRFFDTGQMSKRLLHDLKRMDKGHLTDPDNVYNFEKLVIRVREHNVEIRAIDCAASYHLKGIENNTPTTRQQMMSYFASRTIRKHQEVIGAHKWIALVGNSHSNTYQNIVPGLAELEGAIGLRVLDAPSGKARGVTLDPGEEVRDGLSSQTAFLKGDYRVELETLPAPVSVRPPMPLSVEQRLSRPGMFLIEQSEQGQQVIVHRSRDNAVHRTPVMLNVDGRVYVERMTWTSVHLQPYEDMDALIAALEELNLTRVA